MISFKMNFKEQFDFSVAFNHVSIDFPSERKDGKGKTPEEKKKAGLTYYPVCHFTISVYKKPGGLLLTTYFPMTVLSIVALCIFQQ